jgi:outer membrane lipoprotein-sorting protein
MRRRTTTFVLATALTLGGASACSEADQAEVEQQVEDGGQKVEDGANEVGDEVQEQVEEGTEEGSGG